MHSVTVCQTAMQLLALEFGSAEDCDHGSLKSSSQHAIFCS